MCIGIGIGIGIEKDKLVLTTKCKDSNVKKDDSGIAVIEKKLSLEEAKILRNNLRYYIEDLSENIKIMKKEKREPWSIKTTWL